MSPARSPGREDPDLEDVAWLAAEIGAAPVAVVGLVAGTPPVFRVAARVGTGAAAAATVSACVLACARERTALAVPDLLADARFAQDPVVAPPLLARAFAAAPIAPPGGPGLGAVIVLDLGPRPFLPWQLRALERLARLAARSLLEVEQIRARDTRREQTLGALAGGLALEIQALQTGQGGAGSDGRGSLARAAALARDLLALSGHRSLRPAPLDLNALVEERAPRAAEACGRRLEIRLDRSIGPVAGDGERLGRVIAGLVARTSGNGALRLTTQEVAIAPGPPAPLPAGRYVVLTIGEPAPDDSGADPAAADPMLDWSFDAEAVVDARTGSVERSGPSDLPGLSETRGLLRQSGARLGTARGASDHPVFCIALPRAAD